MILAVVDCVGKRKWPRGRNPAERGSEYCRRNVITGSAGLVTVAGLPFRSG